MDPTIIHEKSEPMAQTREEYNSRLKELYGTEVNGLPIWRVSWGPSQFEKQHGTFNDFTESGIFLREVTEVREVPKYAYLNPVYVLEMLMAVPVNNQHQLISGPLTYECMHPYMHKINNTYLPLNWEFTEWVIDCFYAGMGNKSLRKYVSDEGTNVPGSLQGLEAKRKRIEKITQYLYGNETKATDALAYGTGVVVPHKQFS